MGQITATRNLVATKVVRHAGQWNIIPMTSISRWNEYDTQRFLIVDSLRGSLVCQLKADLIKFVVMAYFQNANHYDHARSSALIFTLLWRYNEHNGVSNHQRLDCVCSTVCSGVDKRKYQSSTSLAFVKGIHLWPVDSPPFVDVIMI